MGDATEDKTESKTQKKNRKKREKEEARKAAAADERKSGGGVEDDEAPIPSSCFSLAEAYDKMLELAVTVMDRATLPVRGEAPVRSYEQRMLRMFMPTVVGNLQQALMLIRKGEQDIDKYELQWTIQQHKDLNDEAEAELCAAALCSKEGRDAETQISTIALQQGDAHEDVDVGYMDPHEDTQRGGHTDSPCEAEKADDINATLWKEAQARATDELDSCDISAEAYQQQLHDHTIFIFRMLKHRYKMKLKAKEKKQQQRAHASMRRK